MLLGYRKRVQRRQARRTPSVFDAQITSDASQELGGSPLHWQRAAQKEQVPGLHRFNIGGERSWWTRQVYAKVFQPLFGTGVRCVRGHYRFSMDISRGRLRRPTGNACLLCCKACPSSPTTSPPTWMRAAVNEQPRR